MILYMQLSCIYNSYDPKESPRGGQRFSDIFRFKLFATRCNSRSGGGGGPTLPAVAANFQAGHHVVKPAIALDLPLETVEEVAFELRDLAAAQAGHVDVVALRASLIVMLFALQVHQIQFVDQPVAFQEVEGSIHRDPVHLRVDLPRSAKDLAGIEMLLGRLDHAEDGSALASHA